MTDEQRAVISNKSFLRHVLSTVKPTGGSHADLAPVSRRRNASHSQRHNGVNLLGCFLLGDAPASGVLDGYR
ncbi:MAG: hypothetical protein WCH75_29905 [Candidatus Binatia bacterium]